MVAISLRESVASASGPREPLSFFVPRPTVRRYMLLASRPSPKEWWSKLRTATTRALFGRKRTRRCVDHVLTLSDDDTADPKATWAICTLRDLRRHVARYPDAIHKVGQILDASHANSFCRSGAGFGRAFRLPMVGVDLDGPGPLPTT